MRGKRSADEGEQAEKHPEKTDRKTATRPEKRARETKKEEEDSLDSGGLIRQYANA